MMLLPACEEETKEDYRDKYIGNYTFSIHKHYTKVENGNQYIRTYDTTYSYSGDVKKSYSQPNEIIVDWGTDIIRVMNHDVLMKETLLTIDTAGLLDSPQLEDEGIYQPAYIHEDTIRFTFYASYGMAHMLYSTWYVNGMKE